MQSCKSEFHPIRSYAEAKEFLATAKPYPETDKTDPHAPYRLEATRKRHMSIRRMSGYDKERIYDRLYEDDQSALDHIALRLYATDVVIWREDNANILKPWISKSTNAFVSLCTPTGLDQHYESRGCFVFVKDKPAGDWYRWAKENTRVYEIDPISRIALFKQDAEGVWRPGCKVGTWKVPVVDKAAARAALKAVDYNDFCLWVQAYTQMTPRSYNQRDRLINARIERGQNRAPSDTGLLALLAQRENWPRLVRLPWFWPETKVHSYCGFGAIHARKREEAIQRDPNHLAKLHARKLMDVIRLAIYKSQGCIKTREVEYLNNYAEIKGNERACERYGV